MKLYKGLVQASIEALQEIFLNHRQADKVVEKVLKSNKKWGSRDRSFIAENTYEIVRWWRLIITVHSQSDAIPQPDQFWEIFGTWLLIKPLHFKTNDSIELPDWPEFSAIPTTTIPERYESAIAIRKIAQSIPDWLDETGEKELGPLWDKELIASNKPAPVVLRVNTLKSNLTSVQQVFGEENVKLLPGISDALQLNKRQNVFSLEAYKNGFFEVQDAGSQLIGSFLEVEPGQTVIDACAGAGGKTLHLAALMQNRGKIISMDIEERKLTELEKRATRNGVKILTTRLIESTATITSLHTSADRLLLDVPCSGLGVLRRNPDTKWKLRPEFLDSIRRTQWHILSTYSKMVKKGGKMVYATCSLLPSESEEQVQRFINEFGDQWEFIKQHRTSIADDGFDGFYMALLVKK